jgi:hypothetical protein
MFASQASHLLVGQIERAGAKSEPRLKTAIYFLAFFLTAFLTAFLAAFLTAFFLAAIHFTSF